MKNIFNLSNLSFSNIIFVIIGTFFGTVFLFLIASIVIFLSLLYIIPLLIKIKCFLNSKSFEEGMRKIQYDVLKIVGLTLFLYILNINITVFATIILLFMFINDYREIWNQIEPQIKSAKKDNITRITIRL